MTCRIGAHKIVVGADAAARAQSVYPGLASAQAQARVPGLLTVEHEPAADAAALERIALWALRRYSPFVAVDGSAGVWIDASGVAHLFGGEATLLEDLVGRIGRGGAHARAAMADSAGAAWALARFGPSRAVVSASGEAGPDIDPLRLAAWRTA